MKIITKYITYQKLNENLTIIHLSDIHISSKTKKKLLKQLITNIKNIKPDYIIISGDLYNSSDKYLNTDIINNFLQDISQIAKVYVCLGNSEIKKNSLKIKKIPNCIYSQKEGLENIDNIGMFSIYSLNFSRDFYYEKGNHTISYLKKHYNFSPNINKNNFNILLCHDPLIVGMEFLKSFDLILFGHTHGKSQSKTKKKILSLLPFYDPNYSYQKKHNGLHKKPYTYNTTKGVTNYHSDYGPLSILEFFNRSNIDCLKLQKKR